MAIAALHCAMVLKVLHCDENRWKGADDVRGVLEQIEQGNISGKDVVRAVINIAQVCTAQAWQ